MFLICGTIAAVATAVAFLLGKRGPVQTVFFSVVAFLLWGSIAWLSMPTLAWNFGSLWSLMFFFGAGLAVTLRMTRGYRHEDEFSFGTLVPTGFIGLPTLMLFVALFTTSGCFGHGTEYRAWLDREPVVREFSQTVAPMSIDHLRLVNAGLAMQIASRTVEQVQSLGSRVHVATPDPQILNGRFTAVTGTGATATEIELVFENELVYVSPLAHSSVFQYLNHRSTPGYVVVSAENPNRFWLVTGVVIDGERTPIELRYLVDGGWFDHHVQRYLRSNGYASTGLAEEMFELDDNGRPFWVVTTFQKTIGFGGETPNGVLIVDAQTGDIERYSMENAPAWADMIQPQQIVHDMLKTWGTYVHGWFNGSMFGAQRDVIRPGDDMVIIQGTDGRTHYMTDFTSAHGGVEGAMSAIVAVDTRTREVIEYRISGATPTRACSAIENAEGVRANAYTCAGTYASNVGGVDSYFIPLQGSDGMLKMYGFINIQNLAAYGVGNSPTAAYQAYQAALTRGGTQLNADAVVHGERIEGIVADAVREGEIIYLRLQGQTGREFFASSGLSPELKWTRAGNRVVITAQVGEESTVPVVAFDNLEFDMNRE